MGAAVFSRSSLICAMDTEVERGRKWASTGAWGSVAPRDKEALDATVGSARKVKRGSIVRTMRRERRLPSPGTALWAFVLPHTARNFCTHRQTFGATVGLHGASDRSASQLELRALHHKHRPPGLRAGEKTKL